MAQPSLFLPLYVSAGVLTQNGDPQRLVFPEGLLGIIQLCVSLTNNGGLNSKYCLQKAHSSKLTPAGSLTQSEKVMCFSEGEENCKPVLPPPLPHNRTATLQHYGGILLIIIILNMHKSTKCIVMNVTFFLLAPHFSLVPATANQQHLVTLSLSGKLSSPADKHTENPTLNIDSKQKTYSTNFQRQHVA